MTTSTKRLAKGFTLIELLTVIAIIGILAAIIIPTVGKVRDTANKTVAASNLRQIGQAGLIYAADNKDALPNKVDVSSSASFGSSSTLGEQSVEAFAAALSVGGGLNDATIWVNSNDKGTGAVTTGASTVNTPTATTKGFTSGPPTFQSLTMAYGVVLGLTTGDAATTAIAFTRGILSSSTKATGGWDPSTAVHGSDGGHIVFIGGNVQWYRNLGASAATGELINTNGNKGNLITDTVKIGGTKNLIEETVTGGKGSLTAGTGT